MMGTIPIGVKAAIKGMVSKVYGGHKVIVELLRRFWLVVVMAAVSAVVYMSWVTN